MTDTPSQPAGPHSNKAMIRNILTGVITTVVGGSILYLVGARHSGSSDNNSGNFLVAKEATTRAWKSYVAVDNLYYRNLQSLGKDQTIVTNLDRYMSEVSKEADRFTKDANLILKQKHIDPSFVSMVTRRFDREKESMDYLGSWLQKIKNIRESKVSDSIKILQGTTAVNDYIAYGKSSLERAANEVESLAKVLSDRYGPEFDLNNFLVYVDYKKGIFKLDSLKNNNNNGKPAPIDSNVTQVNNIQIDPSMVTGKWNATGAMISFLKNRKFTWDVLTTGDKVAGGWKIENNQLVMSPLKGDKIGKNVTWIFDLSNITTAAFTMKLNKEPHNTYSLVKVKVN